MRIRGWLYLPFARCKASSPARTVTCMPRDGRIYGHVAHGPATRPTARPFGTAHGRHGTAGRVPVPARPGAPCSAWAAGLAHDTARARHAQNAGTAPRALAHAASGHAQPYITPPPRRGHPHPNPNPPTLPPSTLLRLFVFASLRSDTPPSVACSP